MTQDIRRAERAGCGVRVLNHDLTAAAPPLTGAAAAGLYRTDA